MGKTPLGFLLGAGAISAPIPICEESVISLGRDEENTVSLDDLAASRVHAQVEACKGALFITDLDSSNGTFVDDVKVNPNEKIPLNSGQEIRIGGKVFFVISAESSVELRNIALTRANAFSRKTTIGANQSLKAGDKEARKKKSVKTPVPPTPQPVSIAIQNEPELPGSKIPKVKLEPTEKIQVSSPSYSSKHSLSGAINAGGLPQIIQMIHAKHFSGSMKVTGKSLSATILFVNGELYAAFAGREHGMEAVYSCALEENSEFTFNRLEISAVEITPRNITRGTMQILMDCCCKIHEKSGSSF